MIRHYEKRKGNEKLNSKGFTLVELIVVVTILAVIIGVAISGIYSYVKDARINTDTNNASAMQKVVSTLSMDNKVNDILKDSPIGTKAEITWTDAQKIDSTGIKAAQSGKTDAVVDGLITPEIATKIAEILPDGLPESKSGEQFKITFEKTSDNEIICKVSSRTIDNELSNNENNIVQPEPPKTTEYGLYDDSGTLIKSWDELKTDGLITVNNGKLKSCISDETIAEVKELHDSTEITDSNEVVEQYLQKFTASNPRLQELNGRLVISDEVTAIDDFGLFLCSNLKQVTIPSTVTTIGDYAFSACYNVKQLNIPNNVNSLGIHAFHYCANLTSITIPSSVNSIGESAFRDCAGLTSINIPSSVTSIGYCVFSCCKSLTSVTIPNSVTSIEDYALEYCTSLTSIIIPDSVTSIGEDAFKSCTSLVSVTIPSSVTTIEQGAFWNCTSLESVNIPSSVNSIKYGAFNECTSLTSVTIPDGVNSIGESAFANCSNLKNINIANSVTTIGYNAFKNCTSLNSVTIPNSVTSIEGNAFQNVPHIYYNGSATGSPWGAKAMN